MKHFIFSLIILSFSNSFSQTVLKMSALPKTLRWENSPLSYSLGDNSIRITAREKTDMFRDPNVTYNTDNAPKLLLQADDDFILVAGIEHSFASKWDAGALIIKGDSLNWVKFGFEKDYTGAHRIVSVVTKNISDDCNSIELKSKKVFLKIAKAGNVITLYNSEDKKKWFLVRHLQMNLPSGFKVGFLAQSPTGKSCEVNFTDIKYEAKKISDPYLGK